MSVGDRRAERTRGIGQQRFAREIERTAHRVENLAGKPGAQGDGEGERIVPQDTRRYAELDRQLVVEIDQRMDGGQLLAFEQAAQERLRRRPVARRVGARRLEQAAHRGHHRIFSERRRRPPRSELGGDPPAAQPELGPAVAGDGERHPAELPARELEVTQGDSHAEQLLLARRGVRPGAQ
jgi:hypothetical protein